MGVSETAKWNDTKLERVIGALLRTGVLLSAATVLAGGVVYLWAHGHDATAYRVFQRAPLPYRSVRGILAEVARLDGGAIIQLGLLLLIATPVARVAFAVAGFALEGDRAYVAISLTVLAILLYSLTYAH